MSQFLQVDPQLLADVIVQIRNVNLSFTELTKTQLTMMFDQVVAGHKNVKLSSLEFFSVDLSLVSPRLLGRAVSLLEVANLSNTELKFEHVHSIIHEILESKVIREINLDFSEVFNVNDDIFAKSLTRLDKVSLACSVMDVAQLESLFTLLTKEVKMKELDLLDTDLTSLSPDLLGRAVNNLVKVNLSGSKLSGDQLNLMFQEFNFNTLTDLNMDYLDLSSVTPESISMVIMNLIKISLKKCSLNSAQLNLIFESLAKNEACDIKLRSANFYGNNLREVDSDYLKQACVRLENVDLSNTNLTEDSVTSLLEQVTDHETCSHLRHLILAGVRLSKVSTETMISAMSSLESMDLSNTGLSPEQVNMILTRVAEGTMTLRQLSLFNVNIEEVDKEVLNQANYHAFINHRYHI